jgi:hypothetical protein
MGLGEHIANQCPTTDHDLDYKVLIIKLNLYLKDTSQKSRIVLLNYAIVDSVN